MIGTMKSELLTALYKNFQPTIMVSTLPCTFFRNNCCSVTKSCPILCNSVDCSMAGSPVLHYLLEFAQIYVHFSPRSKHLLISWPQNHRQWFWSPKCLVSPNPETFKACIGRWVTLLLACLGWNFVFPCSARSVVICPSAILCQQFCWHLSLVGLSNSVVFFQFLEVCFSFVLHNNFSRSSEETEVNLIQFDVFNQKL